MIRLAAIAVLGLVGFSATALAAEECTVYLKEGCTCVANIPPGVKGPFANLLDPKTEVLFSGKGGYTPISTTTAMNLGDQAMTSPTGSVIVDAGANCHFQVASNATISMTQKGSCACLIISGEAKAAPFNVGTAMVGAGLAAAFISLSP
jgi:hypothetical protein